MSIRFLGIRIIVSLVLVLNCITGFAQKSLSVQDYVTVTMDLQGILELKMTTEPQVDFVFNTIQKYQDGITKYNATMLEVNSTVPWDLYAQPATQYWNQEIKYGNSIATQNPLPSEILEIKSNTQNHFSVGHNFNEFIGLTSNWGTNTGSLHAGNSTQFLEGGFGTEHNEMMSREVSRQNILNNKFEIHYRIKPGLPINFPDLSSQYSGLVSSEFTTTPYVQPGYYLIEIVYTLSEDL